MGSIVLTVILIVLSSSTMVKGESLIGCFSSGGINAKFVQISTSDAVLGYVIYQNSKKSIPLIFDHGDYEDNDDERPQEYSSTWLENINGKFNGEYKIMFQGARFYQFDYISNKKNTTSFQENLDAYNDNRTDCNWR